jgi:transcriptional regulator with XRE-family HTH domain
MSTPEPPELPQNVEAPAGDQPLIERMRQTLREQKPSAERAEPAPSPGATRPPRVGRRGEGRRERAQKERRDIARAGEVPPPAEAVRPPEAARRDQGERRAESDPVTRRLARHLTALRGERGWSLQDLAQRTGVSRSTLSRSERGEVSPTAAVLARLAAAYDRTVSALLAEVESQPRSLVRAAEQSVTGEDAWRRRVVSPPYPGLSGSVVDAELRPGTDVVYAPPLAGAEQHLWLITGSIEVAIGSPPGGGAEPGEDELAEILHRHGIDSEVRIDRRVDATRDDTIVLIRGDCLRLRLWGPARLRCLSPEAARYALFTVAP